MATYANSIQDGLDHQPDESYEAEVIAVDNRENSVDYVVWLEGGDDIKQWEVLTELFGTHNIPKSKVRAILKFAKGSFSILFSPESEGFFDKLPGEIKVGNQTLMRRKPRKFESKVYSNSRSVKLFNYPPELPLEWATSKFKQYGVIKKITRNTLREFPDILNGTITFIMNKGATVPRVVWIRGNRFYTFYNGQAEDIKAKTKCRKCGIYGHYEAECAREVRVYEDEEEEKEVEKPGAPVLESTALEKESGSLTGVSDIENEGSLMIDMERKNSESERESECESPKGTPEKTKTKEKKRVVFNAMSSMKRTSDEISPNSSVENTDKVKQISKALKLSNVKPPFGNRTRAPKPSPTKVQSKGNTYA